MKDRELFTIAEVSTRLNIPKHTIRFWGKACPEIFTPNRTKGGQRRFSRRDLFRIEQIKIMRERGMGLHKIKQLLAQNEAKEEMGSIQVEYLARRVAELIKTDISNLLKAKTE